VSGRRLLRRVLAAAGPHVFLLGLWGNPTGRPRVLLGAAQSTTLYLRSVANQRRFDIDSRHRLCGEGMPGTLATLVGADVVAKVSEYRLSQSSRAVGMGTSPPAFDEVAEH
jgi:hypothetical protein